MTWSSGSSDEGLYCMYCSENGDKWLNLSELVFANRKLPKRRTIFSSRHWKHVSMLSISELLISLLFSRYHSLLYGRVKYEENMGKLWGVLVVNNCRCTATWYDGAIPYLPLTCLLVMLSVNIRLFILLRDDLCFINSHKTLDFIRVQNSPSVYD